MCCANINVSVFVLTLLETDGPKYVKAKMSVKQVKVDDSVTLTCSAEGSPNVTFSWFKDKKHKTSGAEMTFPSIKASDSGSYFCQAQNAYGTEQSSSINIDVLCEYFFICIFNSKLSFLKKFNVRSSLWCVCDFFF